MTRSMTAYGSAEVKVEGMTYLIEIHSVNRKGLDLHVHFPKEMLSLDVEVRKKVSKQISRGHLTLRLTQNEEAAFKDPLPNLSQMEEVHRKWVQLANHLGYEGRDAIPFSALMAWMSSGAASSPKLEEKSIALIMDGLDRALAKLIAMKEVEGNHLADDLSERHSTISTLLSKLNQWAERDPKEFKEKITKRLAEIGYDIAVDAERYAREVALMADRVDSTEERTRLEAHLVQFKALLNGTSERKGRELDFLIQEMMREINTILAKAQEIEVTELGLLIKSEVEKIREQVQNIE